MDTHLNAEWQTRLTGFGWLLAAVLTPPGSLQLGCTNGI
jgi:hypothetical protein